jgi:glutaredoxin
MMSAAKNLITKLTTESKVVVFSTVYCPYCVAVKNLFKSLSVPYAEYQFDKESEGFEAREYLSDSLNYHTVPMVFINGKFVGGCDDVKKLHSQNKLLPLLGK